MSSSNNRTFSVASILVPFLLVLGLWVLVGSTRPLDGDAICFVPVSHNIANGNGWVNQHYRPVKVVKPAESERFVWHGYTSPFIWAAFAPSKDYNGIRFAGTVTSLVGLSSLAFMLFVFTRSSSKFTSLISGLLLIGMSPFLIHNGRPEAVAACVLLLLICGASFSRPPYQHIVMGAVLAVLGLTHPVVALICMPLVAIFFILSTSSWKDFSGSLLKSSAAAIGIFGLLLLFTPFPISEWLAGMYYHAQGAIIGETEGSALYYWIKLPDRPLFALTALACISPLAGVAFTSSTRAKRLAIFALSLVFVFFVWYFAIRVATRSYNVAALLPALAVLSVGACTTMFPHASRSRQSTFLAFCLLGLSSLPGVLVCLRYAGLTAFTYTHKADRTQASKELASSLATLEASSANIQISNGLFELTDIVPHATVLAPSGQPSRSYFVLQQANTSQLAPPEIMGYELIINNYIPIPPALGPLKLGNSSPGYNFAIYRKLQDPNPH